MVNFLLFFWCNKFVIFVSYFLDIMRIVVQRVKEASVSIGGETHSSIEGGLLILLGIEEEDGQEDVEWLVRKCAGLRIFDDSEGVMNLNVSQAGGAALVVSQFTLQASTRKGNRPSYIRAAGEEIAVPLYQQFIEQLGNSIEGSVESGIFGADMEVGLINDGPVTIIIDSKLRE